jgi:septation ring formation regulator EzrA
MAKKMTIEDLAAMIERNMASKEDVQTIKQDLNTLTEKVEDGFTKVFVELDGLRDDVRQARGASSIEYAGLREKVEALEEDVRKIKQKVKI